MKARLLEFWQGLNARERWLVGSGALLLAIMLLYVLVWEPISAGEKRLRARLPQLRADAQAVRLGAQEVQRLRASSPPVAPIGDAAATLDALARGQGWQNVSVQPVDSARARLILPSVEFDRWVAWVGEVRRDQRMVLDSAEVEALPAPGMVKVNAVFAAPTAR